MKIYYILLISSFVGSHILLITSRKEVGKYLGFPVFRVMSMKFLSCNEASKHLTRQEVWFSYHIAKLNILPFEFVFYSFPFTVLLFVSWNKEMKLFAFFCFIFLMLTEKR